MFFIEKLKVGCSQLDSTFFSKLIRAKSNTLLLLLYNVPRHYFIDGKGRFPKFVNKYLNVLWYLANSGFQSINQYGV